MNKPVIATDLKANEFINKARAYDINTSGWKAQGSVVVVPYESLSDIGSSGFTFPRGLAEAPMPE